MREGDMDAEREWDEYEWERFLQQQDRKTEKYMELLERYIDHPDRDAIIAKEMGWMHLTTDDADDADGFSGTGFDIEDVFPTDDDEADENEDDEGVEEDEDEEKVDDEFESTTDEGVSFESHPLYQAAFSLTVWIDHALDSGADPQEVPPSAIQLSTQVALCSAKLAAALSGDDDEEIGMTIAYLKRALRAISLALDAALVLERDRVLATDPHAEFRTRAFAVRDEIICLMGSYREQWRGLHGS
jgi:hypothetical protein